MDDGTRQLSARTSKGKRPGRKGSRTDLTLPMLDDRLDRLLDDVLDDGTRRMRDAEAVLDALEERGGHDDGAVDFTRACAEEPLPNDDALEDGDADDDVDGPALARPIASIRFADGDRLDFEGVLEHGELGYAYSGQNGRRLAALNEALATPLRLFVSLTPPSTPVPFLIAGVDRPKDRLQLLARRDFCDVIDRPIAADARPLLLRVPALRGGWWPADTLSSTGHFCGPDGTNAFWSWAQPILFGPLMDIPKSQIALGGSVTHDSTAGGQWWRRKGTQSYFTGCGSGVHVSHRYRALVGFKMRWVIAKEKTFLPHVMHPTIARFYPHWGYVHRRRRAVYTRLNSNGGIRVVTNFYWK